MSTDPNVLGTLSQEELQAHGVTQQTIQSLLLQIGTLEERKIQLLLEVQSQRDKAEGIVADGFRRLNVPDGTRCNIDRDGVIRRIP